MPAEWLGEGSGTLRWSKLNVQGEARASSKACRCNEEEEEEEDGADKNDEG